ncbi:SDR family oxidoreductase [Paenibacillus barcinonensis]|uniref:SDR family oxidoreductase n=1 Tax=Paenibacillus TaxID=44249 RepID=UPI001C1001BB|nr:MULTISPECIES: SDR family oxidoreductase [Paenibacillus]MBU5351837.1 SDR family oxidoreductase [Paenibacillus barcinonensis]MDM5277538.1 SDR family oxidoreductase [Paenibacillus silvae]
MKTWFITGATGGLAIQMVHHLLERGDRVAATIRKPGVLNELQAQYGSRLWQANLDLTNAAQIKEVAERAIGELGTIDVVVNNAAYGLYGAIEEASDDQLEHQFQTNVFGSLRVARAFLPHLRNRGVGHIVQIASKAGHYATPGMGVYSASKWAIEGAFEALAQEIAPFGIKTTIVDPGGIRTGFAASNGRFGEQMDVYRDQASGKMISMMKGEVPGIDLSMLEKLVVGDPDKMARAIIQLVDQGEGSLRVPLGSDAYNDIRAALVKRLDELEAQKDLAYSTDADDVV